MTSHPFAPHRPVPQHLLSHRLVPATIAALLCLGSIGVIQSRSYALDGPLSQVPENSSEQEAGRGLGPDQGQGRGLDQGERRGDRPGGHHPRLDLAGAAATLGTTEAALKEALGVAEPPRPNFASAASQLGISEAQLYQAMGIPLDAETGEPLPPQTRPDLNAAAGQLGITRDQLIEALGLPLGPPPRPDFAAAARQLGVTEAQLIEALGVPPHPGASQGQHQRPEGPGQSDRHQSHRQHSDRQQ
ncbi:MAG: hypothetical protein VKK80_12580 [Prochlorothrix sp.]|nr:hypothetical protein [Prochlorothrix sp.]